MLVDRYEIPGSRHTAASAAKNLLDTRSEVSAKVQLSQLSTLWRRHSSLICLTGKKVLIKLSPLTFLRTSVSKVLALVEAAAYLKHESK